MKTALWIIAVCQIIRLVQNTMQLGSIWHDQHLRDNAYAEYVKSLKRPDFVKRGAGKKESRQSR